MERTDLDVWRVVFDPRPVFSSMPFSFETPSLLAHTFLSGLDRPQTALPAPRLRSVIDSPLLIADTGHVTLRLDAAVTRFWRSGSGPDTLWLWVDVDPPEGHVTITTAWPEGRIDQRSVDFELRRIRGEGDGGG